jgi:hypothetical protein
MQFLSAKTVALAGTVVGVLTLANAASAQVVPEQPHFTKQAFDANGQPLTGPVAAGSTVNFVLSYNYPNAPAGSVSIVDTLSSGLTYVNPSISAAGWNYPLVPYSIGNQETYTNAGLGPATSFTMNVPVNNQGPPKSVTSDDGFYPIPIGGNVYAIFHHEDYGAAKIHCLVLLSFGPCASSYPKPLDTSSTDQRTTPQIVKVAVVGTRIYYPSARYDASNKTYFGIGCFDTSGPGAPCPFIQLPNNPFLPGKYEANHLPNALYTVMAGVVADANIPNRVFMYAIDRVYCVDVTTTAACPSWSSPNLAGTPSPQNVLDIFIEQSAPTQIYVHYGTTSGNKTTVACLNAVSGNRCWPDQQANLTTAQSSYGILSPALGATPGTMTAVCLHPYLLPPAGTIKCFNTATGSDVTSVTSVATALSSSSSPVHVIGVFHIPGTQRVLYARYQDSPPVSCFDFSGLGMLCPSFTPGWGTSTNIFEDYGYAVDPAAPDRCLLGLGNAGVLWRFAFDGSFGPQKGCTAKIQQTFDLNSKFCAFKPKQPTWTGIYFPNPPPAVQLTGGTIKVTIGSTVLPSITYQPGVNAYPFNSAIPATGANSQATIEFTPVYGTPAPTSGYQIELTFSSDVDPQICYQATVSCGPISNSASLTLAGAPASQAGVNLGNATGPKCDPGILKVCKVAGTGITVGTPFNFSLSTSVSHGVLTAPAGPAPGGTCMVGPGYPVGTQVSVTEIIPAGDTVSSITVAPPSQLVSTNLAGGGVTVTMGSGVTEVTYTDKRTGFLEICKKGGMTGSYSFAVDPGSLGPFTVPAGACSPAIEVAAGLVTIQELTTGANITACSTIPASQQGPCNIPPGSQTSVVTVVPGDVSTMTIAFITNERRSCASTIGRNLVPNPSFESQSACPTGLSQLSLATPWMPAHQGTPDYFHACATSGSNVNVPGNLLGTRAPRTGQGYAGIHVGPAYNMYREYIEAPLTNALGAGKYEVSFYVSLSDRSQWAINQMGALLSVGPVPSTGSYVLGSLPQVSYTGPYLQDKLGWTLISGTFNALGGEDHVVIGNFADDPSTPPLTGQGGNAPVAYYYIDDVSVLRCGPE